VHLQVVDRVCGYVAAGTYIDVQECWAIFDTALRIHLHGASQLCADFIQLGGSYANVTTIVLGGCSCCVCCAVIHANL
jgi:hypothetical protein